MQTKLIRFIAKLRRQQPALIILPALILGQILSAIFNWPYILVLILLCVVRIYRAKSGLGILCGLTLGLVSSLHTGTDYEQLVLPEQVALAQLSADTIRRPQSGLLSIKLKIKNVQSLNQSQVLLNKNLLCRAVNLPWKNSASLKPNDLIVFKASYRLFPKNLWPWEYDASLQRRAIDGTCKIKYLLIHTDQKPKSSSIKNRLQERYKEIAGDDEISGLMLSLSLGFRDQISLSSDRIFKQLGLSHVLVLSGMQIGLLYFSVFKLSGLFFKKVLSDPQSYYILSAILSALVSLFIVAMTDFESSATRAWVACILISIASLLERRVEIFKASLASLLVICLVWPGSWAEAGLQLSFAAIFGIAFGQLLARNKLEQFLLPTVLATIFSASVAALWFKEMSLMAIISNLLLAPLFGLIGCYLGLFSLALSYLPDSLAMGSSMFLKFIMQNIFDLTLYLYACLPDFIFIEEISYLAISIFISVLLIFCLHKTAISWLRKYNLFSSR